MARKLTLEFLKTEAGSGAVLGFAAWPPCWSPTPHGPPTISAG